MIKAMQRKMKMKMKRAKKNSDHRQRVSQSVFASPFFFFFCQKHNMTAKTKTTATNPSKAQR